MTSSNLLKCIVSGIAGTLFATAAWASDAHVAPVTEFAKSTVKQWAAASTVIEAVNAQNATTAGLSKADIDGLDNTWRPQTNASRNPMIHAILGTPLPYHLRPQTEATKCP